MLINCVKTNLQVSSHRQFLHLFYFQQETTTTLRPAGIVLWFSVRWTSPLNLLKEFICTVRGSARLAI